MALVLRQVFKTENAVLVSVSVSNSVVFLFFIRRWSFTLELRGQFKTNRLKHATIYLLFLVMVIKYR